MGELEDEKSSFSALLCCVWRLCETLGARVGSIDHHASLIISSRCMGDRYRAAMAVFRFNFHFHFSSPPPSIEAQLRGNVKESA